MIDVNDLRKGVTFEHDDELYKVIGYDHHKTGRGNATIRVKARNLKTGHTIDKTFTSGDRVQDVRLDYHTVQYLYGDGEFFHFMDLDTYEQPVIRKETIEEAAPYLIEGLELKLTFYQNEPLDIELPTTVDLNVVEAEVAIRGDRATAVTKRIVLETGLEIQAPAFVEVDDRVRVDTRTGDYVTRI
ncbi:MAG TPA: elongation factor P [Anaerolineales bacterium]|jgi:elongation factor P|nr:elongation factor P [Anaerolineales bacterium]